MDIDIGPSSPGPTTFASTLTINAGDGDDTVNVGDYDVGGSTFVTVAGLASFDGGLGTDAFAHDSLANTYGFGPVIINFESIYP